MLLQNLVRALPITDIEEPQRSCTQAELSFKSVQWLLTGGFGCRSGLWCCCRTWSVHCPSQAMKEPQRSRTQAELSCKSV